MNDTPTRVPAIIENLNPVTEQFGPLSHDSGQMQIPASVQDIPREGYEVFTRVEQEIEDEAKD